MPRSESDSLDERPTAAPSTEGPTNASGGSDADDAGQRSADRSLRGTARRVATHPATYAVLPLVVIAVVVAVRAGYFVPRFDYAIQELAVQESSRAQRLLGPYSRFGFNHPGPLLFYVNVPAYLVLGKNAGLSLILTRLVVDTACIVMVLVLIDRIGRRTAAWGAAVGIVFFELRAGLEWFRDPWNPYVVVLPIVLALVAGAALIDGPTGRRWRAIVLVIAGSFAVQSHIGTAPLVALALLLGVVGVVRSGWKPGTRAPALVDSAIALGVGLVCWSLPIWEQLTETGNLRAVVSFATSSGETPSLGTVVHPVALAVALGAGHLGNLFGPQPLADVPRAGPLTWTALVVVLVASTAYAVWSWRRARPGLAALAACVPLAALVLLVATTRIKGSVEPYLFAVGLAVGMLAWTVLGAGLGELVERVLQRRRARALLAGAVVVLGVSALAVSGRAFDPPSESFGSPRIAELRDGIDAICATDRPVQLVGGATDWFYIVEVGAALRECVPEVRFEPALELLVGPRLVEPSPAHDVLTVRLERAGVELEPGWRRVASTADIALDVERP